MSSLYEQIGSEFIKRAITEFYERAFADVMIGHFFFKKDKADITAKQILFASSMLGAKDAKYTGKPLKLAHTGMIIRPVHFNRRQVLMGEVLDDLGLSPDLKAAWLSLENQLRSIVITPTLPV
jgi:truncated hemoglobin YjbI